MAKVKIYNMAAEEVGNLELSDDIFAVPYNEPLIHEAVVAYNANNRQGTKCTLTRSEVRGHAKKPWRQKHTGRARHGSTKSPEYKGGGVVFAPKPRDFGKKMNKQAKRYAFLSALSTKLAADEIVVLDKIELGEVKTKEVRNMLNSFNLVKKVVIVTREKDDAVLRASANLEKVTVTTADQLNTYDIVANSKVVMTEEAIKSIEEAFA